MHGNSDIK